MQASGRPNRLGAPGSIGASSGPSPGSRPPRRRPRRGGGAPPTSKGAADVSTTTVATMILILGFVWGGFALILATAVRREREKTGGGDAGAA